MSQSLNTKVEALIAEVSSLRADAEAYRGSRDAADAKLAETIAAQTAELERLRALPVDTTAAEASIQAAIDSMEAVRQTLQVAPAPASGVTSTTGTPAGTPTDLTPSPAG